MKLVTSPEAYLTWRDRALGHLAKDRCDIEKLLMWSKAQKSVIDDALLQEGIKAAGVPFQDQDKIDYLLLGAIELICSDDLLSRIRLRQGNGLELWRKLRSE